MKQWMQKLRLRRMAAGDVKRWQVGASPVEVGPYTYGFRRIRVREWGEGAALRIGSYGSIAGNVTFVLGGNHRTDWISTYPFGMVHPDVFGPFTQPGLPMTRGDIVVGHDVWLGEGATILSGVTIGNGAVVATGAMVTHDIGAYEIWGGNPARQLSVRFPPEVIARLQALRWWDWPVAQVRTIHTDLCTAPITEVLDRLEAIARDQA